MRAFVGSCVALVLLFSGSAAPASILYGDFAGDTVMYLDVREDSGTDLLPLYGAPTVSADSLFFTPSFTAYSGDNGGIDITDGQLNFGIESTPGNFIDELVLAEFGDYSVAGFGNAYVDVSAPVYVTVLEVDGQSVNAFTIASQMTFDPANDLLHDLAADGPANAAPWSGSLDLDITQALIDQGISFDVGATAVQVVLDNSLVAEAEPGSVAYIAKKGAGNFAVTITPEPTTLGLLGLGGLLILGRRRRG